MTFHEEVKVGLSHPTPGLSHLTPGPRDCVCVYVYSYVHSGVPGHLVSSSSNGNQLFLKFLLPVLLVDYICLSFYCYRFGEAHRLLVEHRLSKDVISEMVSSANVALRYVFSICLLDPHWTCD